jgi:hypothetical protein
LSEGTVTATVYSRPGCHLCEEALAELAEIRADHPRLELEVIDIDRDDELLKRYLERIPVVEIAGEEISDLVLDGEAVRERLGAP